MNIQNAVLAANARFGLFERDSVLIVGVSGGADSLALLHALSKLRQRLRLTLVAATLDHGLRGAAGAADAAHVQALAETWHVPIVAGRTDVIRLAEQEKTGIEEAARKARYAFLATAAYEHGATRAATGHHADDQAETVLMHLLRGTGINGLAGMAPKSTLPGSTDLLLVRPLLSVTHNDLVAYCAAHGIEPRSDASNTDTAFTRAWLRHDVLPMLGTRFPGVARALAGLAENAARDSAFLESSVSTLLASAEIDSVSIQMPRALFCSLPAALQYRFVRRAAALFAPDSELSHERTAAVVDLWVRGESGRIIEMPGGLRAQIDGDHARIALQR